MTFSNFQRINEKRSFLNLPLFKNARNFVSGAMRQTKNLSNLKYLNYICYDTGFVSTPVAFSYSKIIRYLKRLNFPVINESITTADCTKLFSFYKKMLNDRNKSEYQYDGIIVKVNDLHVQKQLGFSKTAPFFQLRLNFRV